MPLIGALVVKEFQTWLRGRLTFAAFTLLVLLVSLLVFLLGMLILAPDANAAPALFGYGAIRWPSLPKDQNEIRSRSPANSSRYGSRSRTML